MLLSLLGGLSKMKNKIVANYCRVSTREQAEYGFSLLDQEEKNKFWLEMYPEEYPLGTVVVPYIDEGESASSLGRKEMRRLIEDVKSRKVDVIIVHNLDRLTRRLKDLIYLLELFQRYEISLVSIKEKIETETAMGRFFIMIIILIAQWELETISERTIRGMDRSALEGNYTKAYAPLGYNRVDKRLVVNKLESQIIKTIFKMYLIDHYSLFSISTYLNSISALDVKWSYNRVGNILSNTIYKGEFSNHRISILDHSPKIIDDHTFELAQERLKYRNIVVDHRYVFKGAVRCSDDGSSPEHSSTVKPSKTYLYYVHRETKQRINEEVILEQVTIPVNRYIQNKIKRSLKKNIAYLTSKDHLLKVILSLYDDGLIDEEFRDQKLKDLKNEIVSLEDNLKNVGRGLKKWSVMNENERIAFTGRYIKSVTVDFNLKEVVGVEFVKLSSLQGHNFRIEN